jgi:hypothetical protein
MPGHDQLDAAAFNATAVRLGPIQLS